MSQTIAPVKNTKNLNHAESITLGVPRDLVQSSSPAGFFSKNIFKKNTSSSDYSVRTPVQYYIGYTYNGTTLTIRSNLCTISGKTECEFSYVCHQFTSTQFRLIDDLTKNCLHELTTSYLLISKSLDSSAISADLKQGLCQQFFGQFSTSDNSYFTRSFKIPFEQLRRDLIALIDKQTKQAKHLQAA
jgi:hypothetical protein